MADLITLLAQELSLQPWQVEQAIALQTDGATIPFIARYRKERTGELDETQLRDIFDRYAYLSELEARKTTIQQEIESQGKLTPELAAQITACTVKTELEDLYLPYRPKRRTRATIARERGLEPLATQIAAANTAKSPALNLIELATPFVNPEQSLDTPELALQGAADILAEGIAERADLRAVVRQRLLTESQWTSRIKSDYPEGSTKYEMYREFAIALPKAAPHHVLALLRGEKEGILKTEVEIDLDQLLADLETEVIQTRDRTLRQFYRTVIADAYQRLMRNSITSEVISEKKAWADEESIRTFEANLRNLLLAAPAGMQPTLGIDPGFRTGCKVAAVSDTGQFLGYQAIFPHQAAAQREKAAQTLLQMIRQYGIKLIAIGNGTASRETDAFVGDVLKTLEQPPIKVMVSESGASVYSASPVAIAEFPDLDITVRGAISIARRLQDPLAELVKLDPKSIGVGQYQHDVDQKRLKKKLEETVESCVNYVGVDLNTASKELLTFVSGLSSTVANNIVAFRNQNGAFHDRRTLLKVSKLGAKAFEQAAGFLRIRGGKNPLDNTAVHPERYDIVGAIAQAIDLPLTELSQAAPKLKTVNLQAYVTDEVGLPTLRDILAELEKPGRDPRDQFTYATFDAGITEITDLKPGMTLEGIVTNVANFGAFVDLGVHQDGLVHISQLADRFVKDPNEVVKVGQVVNVRVLDVDVKLNRISLSMRSPNHDDPQSGRSPSGKPSSRQAQPRVEGKNQPGRSPRAKSQSAADHTSTSEAKPISPTSLEALQAKFKRKQ